MGFLSLSYKAAMQFGGASFLSGPSTLILILQFSKSVAPLGILLFYYFFGLIPFLSAFGPFILSSVCNAEFPSFLSEIENLP